MGTVTGRCVIWGAAPVGPAMLELLRPGDHIIAADGGWVTARSLGVQPHCILGDFDSAPRPDDPDAIVLPTVKDDTDTQYATRLALEDGYTDILYLGVLGGKRLDHTLAALQTALGAARQGAKVMLADENTEIHILLGGQSIRLEPRADWYFSLLAMGGEVTGVSEKGSFYELENGSLQPDFPLGVSNVFAGKPVEVSIGTGSALLVLARK